MKLTVDQVAALCHEVNREYCYATGDTSHSIWANTSQWQRDSMLEGVKKRLLDPTAEPSLSHQNWMAHKLSCGWKHGAVKDEAKKEHPCMVPFAELPSEQRAKDFLFCSVVASLYVNDMIEGHPCGR